MIVLCYELGRGHFCHDYNVFFNLSHEPLYFNDDMTIFIRDPFSFIITVKRQYI